MRGKKTARRARKHTSRAIVRHESGSSMVERQPAAIGGVTALEVIALILTARLTASTWHDHGDCKFANPRYTAPVCGLGGCRAAKAAASYLPALASQRMAEAPRESPLLVFVFSASSLQITRHNVAARKGRGGRIVDACHRLLLQTDGLQGRDSDFRRRQMHVGAVR